MDYSNFLFDVGEAHPETVVLDCGLATSMQTRRFRTGFPRRYFNLGIAEQNIVGIASGLARRGFVPLVHSFSNFLARRAHEQVAVSVAWPGCNVKLIAGSCGLFDGRNGPSHLASDDLASMSALPGMMVCEPCDLAQTRALLFQAVVREGPAYLRLRRHGVPPKLFNRSDELTGTAIVRSNQQACATLAVFGSLLEEAMHAVTLLQDRAIEVDLIHVSILRPLQAEPILESGLRTGMLVTVENHGPVGGFGDAVARAAAPLGIRCERLCFPDEYLPAGDAAWQLAYCRLDAQSIAGRVLQALEPQAHGVCHV